MLLLFPNRDSFATGAVRYKYHPATLGESTNRIFLRVEIAGYPIEAVVDIIAIEGYVKLRINFHNSVLNSSLVI